MKHFKTAQLTNNKKYKGEGNVSPQQPRIAQVSPVKTTGKQGTKRGQRIYDHWYQVSVKTKSKLCQSRPTLYFTKHKSRLIVSPDSLRKGSVCTLDSPVPIEPTENYLFQYLIAIETDLIPTMRYSTPGLFNNDYDFIVYPVSIPVRRRIQFHIGLFFCLSRYTRMLD